MMLLFRSTFITATSMLVIALSTFSMSASAAPQFGRPFFHALDAVTESMSSSVSPLTPVASPTAVVDLVPVESDDPGPDPQVAEATPSSSISSASTSSTSTSSASSTAGATQAAANAGTNTNGAPRSLGGGTGVVLGVVVSAVWLVL